MAFTAKILLLGSGELGREFVISAKRLGCEVIACDSYAGAPAMQVADGFEIFSMLDAELLRAAIERHQPDYIVPEIEAIRTEVLADVEAQGRTVVPSARATIMTMNRDRIREDYEHHAIAMPKAWRKCWLERSIPACPASSSQSCHRPAKARAPSGRRTNWIAHGIMQSPTCAGIAAA
jgi:phosphoribosylaminoimidazole carboxylase (NCAIR synthetase)